LAGDGALAPTRGIGNLWGKSGLSGSVRRALVEAVTLRAHGPALFPPCFRGELAGTFSPEVGLAMLASRKSRKARTFDGGRCEQHERVERAALLRPVCQDLDKLAASEKAQGQIR